MATPKIYYCTIGIVLAVMLTACTSSRISSNVNAGNVSFQTASRIPVIKVLLNGKSAFFLVDTGASVSVINEHEESDYGFIVDNFDNSLITTVSGFGGQSEMKNAYNCKLDIGDLHISHIRFKTRDLNPIVNSIYATDNLIIVGILGADLLTQYRVKIDFINRAIIF